MANVKDIHKIPDVQARSRRNHQSSMAALNKVTHYTAKIVIYKNIH
jgi:hypothetical protein